jgi:hypothetical protein
VRPPMSSSLLAVLARLCCGQALDR